MVLLRLWIVNRKRYVVKTEENLCHNLCDDRREHEQYADEIVERKATCCELSKVVKTRPQKEKT